MILQPKPVAPGWAKRWTMKWFTTCRTAVLDIVGYALAIFLAEMLVKIWIHQ